MGTLAGMSNSRLFRTILISSRQFCTASNTMCQESNILKLVPEWNVPVYVKNAENKEVLENFVKFGSFPKAKEESSLDEVIEKTHKRRFKFPGFTERLGSNHLERQDERSDSIFYETPRFVTHIDDFAIESLLNYYDENLKSETRIVDLCSSWISHLPNQLNFKSVIGIGMNEKELKANKRLTKHYVVDLNKNPKLNMVKSESIDSVLCTVSVDYLIRPFEVFSEVHRILKPGGSFIVSFSNRMFGTKAIKAWLMTNDEAHLYIVTYYFHISAKWEKVTISDITQKHTGDEHRDPMYLFHAIK